MSKKERAERRRFGKLFSRPKWAKIGLLGFPKSGKTYTGISIACGLHKQIGSDRPLMVFDTEGGFEYQIDRIRDLTGQEPDGLKAHSFADLMRFQDSCEEGDIVLIDSVTHPWRELLAACEAKKGKGLQGIMAAKTEWAKYTNWFLASPVHVIMCGRAGYEFDYEDVNGKRELVKTGTKMKTEGETGFEPSLLVEMYREERQDGSLTHAAIVKGDRFGVIDGRKFVNPTFADFKPFFDLLDLGGGPTGIDTSAKTAATLDDDGNDAWRAMMKEREIILDEIKDDLTSAFPGQSAAEKKIKIDLVRECFAGASWTRIDKEHRTFTPDVLRDGRERLRARIEAILQEATA